MGTEERGQPEQPPWVPKCPVGFVQPVGLFSLSVGVCVVDVLHPVDEVALLARPLRSKDFKTNVGGQHSDLEAERPPEFVALEANNFYTPNCGPGLRPGRPKLWYIREFGSRTCPSPAQAGEGQVRLLYTKLPYTRKLRSAGPKPRPSAWCIERLSPSRLNRFAILLQKSYD